MKLEPLGLPVCPECGNDGDSGILAIDCSYCGGWWPKGYYPTQYRVRNLTPHPVTLIAESGQVVLDPEKPTPRLKIKETELGKISIKGVPVLVVETRPEAIEGLPEPELGVLLIVSRVVAEAARDRDDLLVPDDFVRDEQGQVIGARRLARVGGTA